MPTTPISATCLPLPPSQDSPTARRKSPYWAKVMRGSGSSLSHCLSTPVMAWMGKLSSLTVEGSEGRVGRAGEHSAGRSPACAQVPPAVAPTCLQRLPELPRAVGGA